MSFPRGMRRSDWVDFRLLNDLPSRAWIGDDQEIAFFCWVALICFSGNEGQLYEV
jgi:hypothetical protein